MPKTVDEVMVKILKTLNYVRRPLPYASPLWYELSRKIRNRDGGRCVSCSGRNFLDVHHKRKIKDGGTNLPSNLETLCRVCHRVRHPELRKNKYVSR